MNRHRRNWERLLLAGLALTLLSGCFWRKPEIEEKEVPLGYRGEARVKPFLAAARFLSAMGLEVEDCFSLAQLPEPDVCVFLPAEGDRSPSSAQRLLEWTGKGGHVIYLLQGGDSFLNDFADDAKWEDETEEQKKPGEKAKAKAKSKAPEEPSPVAPPPKGQKEPSGAPGLPNKDSPKPPAAEPGSEGDTKEESEDVRKHLYPFLKALSVEVVDRGEEVREFKLWGRRWKVELPSGQGFQVLQSVTGTIQVYGMGPRGRRAFLSFPHGNGRVTLIADGKLWRNRYIGEADHAAFLWQVVCLGPAPTGVWIVRSTKVSLFQLLWQNGRRPLISLGLFLLIWLWWATRRFGPALPEPEAGSREFVHHLDLSGNFLWRLRARQALVEPARRRLRARHSLHDGSTATGSEALARLARQSGLDVTTVERALWGEVPREAHKLTTLLAHLQILDSPP